MTIHPVLRYTGTEYWVTILLFSCVTILAWVKTAYPRKLNLLFREVFTQELAFEEKSITPSSIALFIIYLSCSVLLAIQLVQIFKLRIHYNETEEIGVLALGILGFYVGKTTLIWLSGFIFEEQVSAWEYISEVYIFAHFLGIVLLPLMIINIYAGFIDHKLFDELVMGCIAILLVYRTIKMIIFMINKGLRMMYLFLYICALEILPLALFIRYGIMNHL
jgi:hypothetical protein